MEAEKVVSGVTESEQREMLSDKYCGEEVGLSR